MRARTNNLVSSKRRRLCLTLVLGLCLALFLAYCRSSDSAKLPNIFKFQGFLENWDGQPVQEPLDAVWQPVAHTKNKFYVFSAFLDRRWELPAIRVIAATHKNLTDEVFCHLWVPGNLTSHVLKAEIKDLHICIKPLVNSIDRAVWMVEWIELNRMLGASHFHFYDQNVGKRLDCFLKNYENRKNLFTHINYPLPFEEFEAQAQLAANNDCLYRSMSQAEWLLSIDIDEVIIPHKLGLYLIEQSKTPENPLPTLFESLVNHIGDIQGSKPSALLFHNAHFYFGFEDDQFSPVPLVTSRKTRRREIEDYKYMKYAVRASRAVELNTHRVREMVPGSVGTLKVDHHYALMHHYRVECKYEENCTSGAAITNSTIDRSAHMWVKQLWKRVDRRLTELYKLCP